MDKVVDTKDPSAVIMNFCRAGAVSHPSLIVRLTTPSYEEKQ